MEKTKKALFLPFMQIPTGHHHVADALITEVNAYQKNITCDKVDILSYSYGIIEKIVSSTYLAWISHFPGTYDWLYRKAAYKKASSRERQYLYETMFMYFLKRLVHQKNPDILFCTHALPSNIASALKRSNRLDAVIINVYTDYFINRVWGITGIDYHFVPSLSIKKQLLNIGVKAEKIFVTGIPVHPVFQTTNKVKNPKNVHNVLVTGGSLGIGFISELLNSLTSNKIHYFVLCGKNEKLYNQLSHKDRHMVSPLPYITRKEEMNALYDMVDAVLTKPGGVTISECLRKQKPIFVYNPLPGQEKVNADYLKQAGLGIPIEGNVNEAEQQLMEFFADERKQKTYENKMNAYQHELDHSSLAFVIDEILQ